MEKFVIAPDIIKVSEPLISLTLCDVRLHVDGRWPWLVLIPRRPGAREIEHLSAGDRILLIEETVAAGAGVRAVGSALGRPVEKLNVGALGNITPQLHVHVVGRRGDDPAWPGPIWGFDGAAPYDAIAWDRAHSAAVAILAAWSPKIAS